jgi:hypothetical protein
MSDVIGELRQAMAEFDGCTPAERAFRVHCAQRVIRLVRRLLAEVDGERAGAVGYEPVGSRRAIDNLRADNARRREAAGAEPLGPPNPAHGELPFRDDDYTAEAMNRTAD